MSALPPPPPLPKRVSGEPKAEEASTCVSSPDATSVTEAASPEDLSATLEFVNRIRRERHWPPLDKLPTPQGKLASERPLALALGVTVIKHGDGGMLYALTRSSDVAGYLIEAGCNLFQTCEATREKKQTIYEIHLPRYLYDLAS